MSAFCPPNLVTYGNACFPLAALKSQGGFTLLEMLVVMTLVGLLAATVTPSLYKTMERRQVAAERQLLIASIERLGYRSYLDGQARQLTSSGADNAADYPVELPHGWQLEAVKPVEFFSTGICGGGTISLVDPDGSSQRYLLTPPVCKLLLIEEPVTEAAP